MRLCILTVLFNWLENEMKTLLISSTNPKYFDSKHDAIFYAIMNTAKPYQLKACEAVPKEDGSPRFIVDVHGRDGWEGFIAA